MSFLSETKQEICKIPVDHKCCALAEACGVLLYGNAFSRDGIRIMTESKDFARRLPRLFQRAFDVSFDTLPDLERKGKLQLQMINKEKIERVFDLYGYGNAHSVSLHINFALLESTCCRNAFFRGAFLAGGFVTNPEKGYHLELLTSHSYVSREMATLLQEEGFSPKETARGANQVVYFKQSEAIEDYLTTVGAPVAATKVMMAKVEKDLRNRVNRRVNCDAANLDKAIEAAQSHLEAIRRLDTGIGLHTLPEKLQETAALRMAHPELTLSELAEQFDPPVTKSCLHHRLRKLSNLAKESGRL
ncbi:MAG: DNA-binding protein WhiA [Oscillospiraceae bacterium]|jgi:DNA-binding protein WhiA